ncbi:hypothetical protein [Pedobacter glucosidilyticus]|uniref:hypothetical protein n=1 Tax=Pedobacter glucosidilyticus TaxID=1122941 RepID=UPI0026EF7B57|nr:hypothetical protein [Pedobacter glucosidilyticus]
MEKENEQLLEKIKSCISYYYPKGLNEVFDWEVMYETVEYKSLMQKLEESGSDWSQWNLFKENLDKMKFFFVDYSMPTSYNGCFYMQICLFESLILTICVSPIFPAYFFMILETNSRETFWCKCPWEHEQLHQVLELFKSIYPKHVLIPEEVLKVKIPDYSVDPFDLGKARVINYLFTYLPQYDDLLI